jgi:hypothetical protein
MALINISKDGAGAMSGLGHFTIPKWFTAMLGNSTLVLVVFLLVIFTVIGIKVYSIYKKKTGN